MIVCVMVYSAKTGCVNRTELYANVLMAGQVNHVPIVQEESSK